MKRGKNKIYEGTLIGDIVIFLVVALMCFITLYPMYYVLIISLSDPIHATTLNVYIWPKTEQGIFYFGAYEKLVMNMAMWRAYVNTIIYTIIPTVLMLITCSMCAYPLTSPKLVGKKYITIYLLIPMYFSGGLKIGRAHV